MKGVYISNFFNHHQKPFMDALNRESGVNCVFIQTVSLPEDRISMGYPTELPDYVVDVSGMISGDAKKKCNSFIRDADFVIYNNAEDYVLDRLKSGKLTLLAEERFCKREYTGLAWIRKYLSIWKHLRIYPSLYFLGMSGFFAGDLNRFGMPVDKIYNWGYFPPLLHNEYVNKTKKKRIEILWASRFVDFKHPEVVVRLAKRIRDDNLSVHLTMIGNGELLEKTRNSIEEENLASFVTVVGSLPFLKVREEMDKADVVLSTSDSGEGWGVTINEGMSSSCAVIASHVVGSAPLLIKNGVNGLIYENGNDEDLYNKLLFIINNPDKIAEYGRNAFDTISNIWNGANAAERFVQFITDILETGKCSRFPEGPLSKAKILENDWYSCEK